MNCKKRYDVNKPDDLKEFTKGLHTFLTNLACESSDIAKGMLRQIKAKQSDILLTGETLRRYYSKAEAESSRVGLDAELKKRMQSNEPCPGLKGLSEKEKKELLKVEKQ